jgi:hypothetical protein
VVLAACRQRGELRTGSPLSSRPDRHACSTPWPAVCPDVPCSANPSAPPVAPSPRAGSRRRTWDTDRRTAGFLRQERSGQAPMRCWGCISGLASRMSCCEAAAHGSWRRGQMPPPVGTGNLLMRVACCACGRQSARTCSAGDGAAISAVRQPPRRTAHHRSWPGAEPRRAALSR